MLSGGGVSAPVALDTVKLRPRFLGDRGSLEVFANGGQPALLERHDLSLPSRRNALVTCDGMLCSLQDFRPGQRVRVTALAEGHWSLKSRIEALDERSTFPIAIATVRPNTERRESFWRNHMLMAYLASGGAQ